jgi:hypothetical protein
MWHAWERKENCTGCWWECLKERDGFEDRRRWEDGIRMDLRVIASGVWSGFTLFRIGTGGRLW